MENFCVKRVMVKAGILPSTSKETVGRVMGKAGLKWTRIQRKRVLTKNDLKLSLLEKFFVNFLKSFTRSL